MEAFALLILILGSAAMVLTLTAGDRPRKLNRAAAFGIGAAAMQIGSLAFAAVLPR